MESFVLGVVMSVAGAFMMVLRRQIASWMFRISVAMWRMEFEPGEPNGRVVAVVGLFFVLGGLLQLWSRLSAG